MHNTRRSNLTLALVLVMGLILTSAVLASLVSAQGPVGTSSSGPAITNVAFEVIATDPVTNEVGVPLAHTINLTYSQAISATLVNTGTIVAQGMMGGLVTSTYSVEGAYVTLTPLAPSFP